MAPFAESLVRSPELFPLALDVQTDGVTLVRLRRSDYESASFLDERILSPGTAKRALPWRNLESAVAASSLSESCQYIFHIGHVGSTLLSRLLGCHPRLFVLREPAILRTLAEASARLIPIGWSAEEIEGRLSALLKLWSRTFEPSERVCLKATSYVSEMAAGLLCRSGAPRAILMYSAPEIYLAAILGAPNSPQEASALAPSRLKRLAQHLGDGLPSPASQGEMVAMSWACEMTALSRAKEAAGDRAIFFDFDAFLARPAPMLSEAFAHLGISANETELETMLRGPQMRRYSKAPEHAYDAQVRRADLQRARRLHAPEIRNGLAWLERAAAQFAPIEEAVGIVDKFKTM